MKKDIDWAKLDIYLSFDASKSTCSQEFEMSEDTLDRRIRKKHNMTFMEYKRKKLEKTVLKLKQKMIQKAIGGDNTCLIFTLKNLSTWSDKNELTIEEKKTHLSVLVAEVSKVEIENKQIEMKIDD
jgi:hypothetical protein